MATSITPQMAVDEIVLKAIQVNYDPTWDGAQWVLTPADIRLDCRYTMGVDENIVSIPLFDLQATDLPPAGQTALQDLYTYIEGQIAALYP
jgi:hypothetical protein